MKMKEMKMIVTLLLVAVVLTGCTQGPNQRCCRYWGRTYQNSRQVESREEFMNGEEDLGYVPMTDEDAYGNQIAVRDTSLTPPSKNAPGESGSRIPGIDSFKDPSAFANAKKVFANVHFPYNSSLVKDKASLETLQKIGNFMKNNPQYYLYIEGHCDQRGAEAYNLALGSRRSNAIRNLLVKEGVNSDHLFTISYGKERPIAKGNNEDAWRLNRRGQFKLYQS